MKLATRLDGSGIARWILLGWFDLKLAYRRTLLGPFWQTVQVLIWSAGLTLVFGPLHADEPLYVPYVVVGMSVWNLMSNVLVQGSGVFVAQSSLILSIPLHVSSHVIRLWSRLVLQFGFQMLVFLPIVFIYDLAAVVRPLEALVGIGLLCVLVFPVMMLVAFLGTFFRDFEHLVSVGMRFLFFMTPVFWIPQTGQFQAAFVQVNPFYYPLEMVRRPLLGMAANYTFLLPLVGGAFVLAIFAWYVQRRWSKAVPTWL